MVGPERFELSTSCTPCKRATRLRYGPKKQEAGSKSCHAQTCKRFFPNFKFQFSKIRLACVLPLKMVDATGGMLSQGKNRGGRAVGGLLDTFPVRRRRRTDNNNIRIIYIGKSERVTDINRHSLHVANFFIRRPCEVYSVSVFRVELLTADCEHNRKVLFHSSGNYSNVARPRECFSERHFYGNRSAGRRLR